MAEPARLSSANPPSLRYPAGPNELVLSNQGQLELLEAVLGRGAPLRAKMRGRSMTPCIRDCDIVTVGPVSGEALDVGDIVAFLMPGSERLAVHRIIARARDGWLVRGDACAMPDGVVDPSRILGRVTGVERHEHRVRLGVLWGRKWLAYLSRRGTLFCLNRSLMAGRRFGHVLVNTVVRRQRS